MVKTVSGSVTSFPLTKTWKCELAAFATPAWLEAPPELVGAVRSVVLSLETGSLGVLLETALEDDALLDAELLSGACPPSSAKAVSVQVQSIAAATPEQSRRHSTARKFFVMK